VVDVTIRRLVLLDRRIDPREAVARTVVVSELWADVLAKAIIWLRRDWWGRRTWGRLLWHVHFLVIEKS